MPALEPWDRYRSTEGRGTVRSPTDYPTTNAAWQERMAWLHACYMGDGYSANAESAWHLFRAADDNGKEIARTRRIFSDFRFITSTDAQALTGGRLVLQLPDELAAGEAARRKALLDAGRAVWARSGFAETSSKIAWLLSLFGMVGLEAVRTNKIKPFSTKVVFHDPRNYWCQWDDATGTELERVVIIHRYYDAAQVDDTGNVTSNATLHVYRRELTRDRIEVRLDGALVPEESGNHNAGVVPFWPIVWQPVAEPGLGLNAAHGIESAIAESDSLMTQVVAVGHRMANPVPTVTGAKVTAGADMGQFGRWLYHPNADVRFGYMEPSMGGVATLLDAIEKLSDRERANHPEFGLFGGANLSAEALRLMAARFESKIEAVRSRFLPGVARIFGIATAMDADQPWDPEGMRFEVAAGPVLPPNVSEVVQDITGLSRAQLLRRADAVRHLQRVGYVPGEVDPDKYAAEAQDEGAARATTFFAGTGGTQQ